MNQIKLELSRKTTLSVQDAAIYSGKSINTIRRWIREGLIKAERTELGHWRINTKLLQVYLDGVR